MKLSEQTLSRYFGLADPTNSHYKAPTNTFDFVDRNSTSLVCTVGDSWTFGSDLDSIEDSEIRLSNVFGNVLADGMEADFLNLSRAGSSNFFVAEKIEKFDEIVAELEYKNIYIICVFTECGRGFNSHHDSATDYISWFQHNPIENFLHALNESCVNRIKKIRKHPHVKLMIGSNFVDNIGIDKDILIPKPWFRVLGIDCPHVGYAGSTGVNRLLSVNEFTSNNTAYKSWISDLIEKSHFVDRRCQSDKLIRCHPRADGHKIWADYLKKLII